MRGRRQKPAYVQREERAARERHKTQVDKQHSDIIAAINCLAHEIQASRNQQECQDQKTNTLEKWGIAGIYFAACVALLAIWIASHDASGQRIVMQGQLDQMKASTIQTDKIIEANSRLADAASRQAEVAAVAVKTSRDAMVASQRAWVGPRNARLEKKPEFNKEMIVFIDYQNTGREPALKTIWDAKEFIVTDEQDKSGVVQAKIDDFLRSCKNKWRPTDAQIVYPSTGSFGSGYVLRKTISASNIDQSFLDGKKIAVVAGCFNYMTVGQVHRSTFCYFYREGVSDQTHWNICIKGNEAD